jgi:dephospho-CoA kinase
MLPMLHVGLTGNIASGKSQAALMFAELGAHIIDADRVVHQLLSRGTRTYQKIIDVFGNRILDANGEIDRKSLGQIVFSNEEKRKLLNRLTHQDVGAEILRRIFELEQKFSSGIIMVDAALMVETGSYKMYDRLIVVTCDPSLQITRLMNRDQLSKEAAIARMNAQLPIEEKIRLANYTIDTTGTLKKVHDQVEAIYRDLLLQELRMKESG